ncbi:MAG: hypothetical protein ACREQY_08870, partial [Candidatus Binatia bacterium]
MGTRRDASVRNECRNGAPARRDRPLPGLFALLAAAIAAAPLHAVAVSVTVTDAAGEPVAKAEIDLGFGATGTTDRSGRATIEVPEDRIGEENVLVGITFVVNETTGETRTVQRSVTLGPSLDFRLTTAELPERPSPTDGVPPGRELGCAFAGDGFQLALGVGYTEIDEPPIVAQSFDFRGFVNGVEVVRESGTKNADQLAEVNRSEKKEHEADELGPLAIRIPLSRGSCRDGSRNFVPALRLGAGQTDVDFSSTHREFPEFSQRFTGDGRWYQAGFDATILRTEKRCVYNLGIEHRWSESIDVRRSVDLADVFFPLGAVTLRDDVTYEFEQTSLRLVAGHAGDRFLPYAGLSYTWFEAELDQSSRIDLAALVPTAPPGTTIVEVDSIRTRFDDDYVEAVAGVVARLRERLALRAEGRVGEDTFAISASAVLS